jgi:hypothetical protein
MARGNKEGCAHLPPACALLGVSLLLYKFTRVSIALFHWAEQRIDRSSPLHMLAFLAVTLPFNIGLPIPIVHQARGWA